MLVKRVLSQSGTPVRKKGLRGSGPAGRRSNRHYEDGKQGQIDRSQEATRIDQRTKGGVVQVVASWGVERVSLERAYQLRKKSLITGGSLARTR